MVDFLGKDFNEPEAQRAAAKNAYALLGQHKWVAHAMAAHIRAALFCAWFLVVFLCDVAGTLHGASPSPRGLQLGVRARCRANTRRSNVMAWHGSNASVFLGVPS